MRRGTVCLLGAISLLAACTKTPEVACSDPASVSVTTNLIKQGFHNIIKKRLSESSVFVDSIQVDAYIAKLDIGIKDIRTTKKDPNSAKKFCAGSLHVGFPAEIVQDADAVRQLQGYGSTADFVRGANNLDFEANVLKGEITYAVQPTDDGKKVYAEMASVQVPEAISARVISDAMLKPALEANQEKQRLAVQEQAARKEKARQDAEVAAAKADEEQRLVQQRQQEEQKQAAAQRAQDMIANAAANLEQAKASIDNANKAINIVWQSTTKDIRARLLPEQREWLKKRELECKVKSLQSGSNNSDDQETFMWNCHTDMTRQRTEILTQEILELTSVMSDPRVQNARLALDQANAQLNVAWQGISSGIRKQLLPAQRDWLHLRMMQCQAKAENVAYNGPVNQEVARLSCETQMTYQRLPGLRQNSQ